MTGIDRRTLLGGLCAAGIPDRATAQGPIAVDRFGSEGPRVYLLHGSDGLTDSGRYQFAAQTIAKAGHMLLLPRYFEATADNRARYGNIRSKFTTWLQVIEAVLTDPSPGNPSRVAVVGFSPLRSPGPRMPSVRQPTLLNRGGGTPRLCAGPGHAAGLIAVEPFGS